MQTGVNILSNVSALITALLDTNESFDRKEASQSIITFITHMKEETSACLGLPHGLTHKKVKNMSLNQ